MQTTIISKQLNIEESNRYLNHIHIVGALPHHFYAAPAPEPGKNFDPAPAPTLPYSSTTFF
jgi:hypothetical protein